MKYMSNARELVRSIADENVTLFDDGLGASEFTGFIDTGSYTMNAAFSGTIFGGVPNNKIFAFAGPESSGKTFLALAIIKQLLTDNPDSVVAYYDTEAAVTKKMLIEKGIDPARVLLAEVDTVQNFSFRATKILNSYMKKKEEYEKSLTKPKKPKKGEVIEENKPFYKLFFVLDSLGMLSTSKELSDLDNQKESRDMSRAAQIKAAFRALTLKCARANVPILVTNHIYDSLDQYKPTQMSGGSGLKYAASCIAFFRKGKLKEGAKNQEKVVGTIINVTMVKSRLSKENTQVESLIRYDSGLDRYYGLFSLLKDYKIIKYSPVKKGYNWPDGRWVSESDVEAYPEEYWTMDILKQFDEKLKPHIQYGAGEVPSYDEDEEEYDPETGEILEKEKELLLENS